MALWKVAQRKLYDGRESMNREQVRRLHARLDERHHIAIKEIDEIIQWLDDRKPQPTTAIYELYERVNMIDSQITTLLSKLKDMEGKKAELQNLNDRLQRSEQVSHHL